jgi:hypothetical protein
MENSYETVTVSGRNEGSRKKQKKVHKKQRAKELR